MGTTSEKLTYLNTTKTLIKEELNLGGANITNEPFRQYKGKLEGIYKDFLANGTDTLWNNWLPKVNGTGETITLNNTIEAKMGFVYKGNTSQIQYSGKNLMNIDTTYNNSLNNVSCRVDSEGIITINGTPSADTNFTNIWETLSSVANERYYLNIIYISGSATGNIGIYNQDSSQSYNGWDYVGNLSANNNTNKLFTYALNCNNRLIKALSGVAYTNLKFKLQFTKGTTADYDYEPYTGNQPSPNPDYPQNIQVVSGDNTIKVEGKNLFDNVFTQGNISNNTTTNRIVSSNNLYLKSGNYTISTNLDLTSYKYAVVATSSPRPTSNDNILFDSNWKTSSYTLNLTTDAYVHILIAHTNQFSPDPITPSIMQDKWFQLEKGSTATTYTPYVSQTYPITLPIGTELCKIGDYQDSIVKDNGKWYLNKQIGKVVLNGSEIIEINPNGTNSYFVTLIGINKISSVINTICNYFRGINYNDRAVRGDNVIYGEINQNKITIRNTTYTSIELFTTFLSTYKPIVYYVLATPTNEEITDTTLISQLEAIKKSYNTQTSISQVNNDLPFELDVVTLGNN